MTNPFENRDLTQRLLFPALSWSSYSQFTMYDKEDWYRSYVLGQKTLPNAAMLAGQIIGEKLATDPSYLPEVPRPEQYEVELKAMLGGIQLIGHIDFFSLGKKYLGEVKTSQSSTRWTKASVAKHDQITFYAFLLWLNYKIRPEDLKIELIYIPVEQQMDFEVVRSREPIQIIPTKRSLADILKFAVKLKKVHKEMIDFVSKQSIL